MPRTPMHDPANAASTMKREHGLREVGICVKLEWDMGHRLPNHRGACSNMHGHRYVGEFYFAGPVNNIKGMPDEGMVIDFGDVKTTLRERLNKGYDHKFLMHREDTYAIIAQIPGVILVDYVPTAENIAQALFNELKPVLPLLLAIKLYETPTSYAEVM